MALSKDALKNLFDAMQKLSLAVTALCVGLLSSVLLSHPSAEKDAEPELEQLLLIRDRLGKTTVYDLLANALSSALKHAGLAEVQRKRLQGQVEINSKLLSPAVELALPRMCRDSVDSTLGHKTFENISTLDEMREAWNAIGAIRFWQSTPDPDDYGLYVGNANGRKFVQVHWKSSAERGIPLRRFGDPAWVDSDRHRVGIEYNFSSVLDGLDRNELLEAFQLTPEQIDFLKTVSLTIDLPATPVGFSATHKS